jgi:phosphorylcholine metabolism protein LicD
MIQDSFLLDEVRCGFMIPAAVKQAWAAELEVLMEIDRVCKKHNIQYFADWGTLLGTVRHGGFIPWDDDLDIVMKREDYQKFMNVARFDMEEGFDVQTFRNHDDCWLFMGKVVGRNGFCFEKEHLRRFHNFPYIACVDVFVLDYVYKDPEKEEKRRTLCKYMLGVADSIAEGGLTSEEKERSLKKVEEMYGKRINRIMDPVEMRRYLYGEVEKIFGEVPEKDADNLTQIFPWGLLGKDFQFPKEYYEKAIELPFEDTVMPVPMMYDKMLRKRYGEYCRLVKDAAGHDYPFFEGQKKNLQKVLDFELPEFRMERAKLFRSEEEEVCKNLSYKVMAKECFDELGRMKEELTMDSLAASQQLAIDFGNMMEQVLGEGGRLIGLLEQYCEALYVIYEQLLSKEESDGVVEPDKQFAICTQSEACLQLNDILQTIADELEQNIFGRKMVLFLPVLARDWSGLHSLWQEYTQDETCDVYVAPLPYYYKDYDGSLRKVCYEAAEFPEAVQVLDYNILTAEYLEMLHPEVIVIQNPYDSWNPAISVPEMFYSENIRKYTDKLAYVPPFVLEEYSKSNERECSNMKYYVTMPGVVYADWVMVQSENMRQMYMEKLVEFAGEETKAVWEQRVSVFDIYESGKECNALGLECNCENGVNNARSMKLKKKMLYGISFGAYVGDIEAARSKIERNLKLFETHKSQIDLTVVIFPDNETSKELRDYVDGVLKQYSARMLGQGKECNPLNFDAYYGDAMPLVMKFRDAKKPVMVQDIYVE